MSAVPDLLPALRAISLSAACAARSRGCRSARCARARAAARGGPSAARVRIRRARRLHLCRRRRARDATRRAACRPILRCARDCRLRHILVDEFQDISLGQFAAARGAHGRLGGGRRPHALRGGRSHAVDLPVSRGRGRALPADPRSGHRRASARGAASDAQFPLGGAARRVDECAFRAPLAASDDVRTSAVAFTAECGDARAAEAPAVEISWFAPGARVAEAAAIAARIAALRRNLPKRPSPYSSVPVPTRDRLRRRSAPRLWNRSGVKIVPLAELSVIRDLVALTRALHHLADRAAWLVVLRAPWCGATLATLAILSERNDPLLLWEASPMRCASRVAPAEERARLVRVRAVLEARARRARRRRRLPSGSSRTWVQLGALRCLLWLPSSNMRALFSAPSRSERERQLARSRRSSNIDEKSLRRAGGRRQPRADHDHPSRQGPRV